ncbi:hypothetical protein OIB37_34230 [Streptomyces sp. NBC_00820]|uniref:hypothetical protein n=1 Tax=Streptomyces sp. NBC_00820 TaxID=2975842 RepID=UPI002ED41DE3|nr:hypothetical protein OIB37_34230 [Streptomyces sp. NBC_00820]
MAHHHKSNKEVEGNPDYGHGRGLPRRPDEVRLQERTVEDRREMGLPVAERQSPQAEYEAEQAEIDLQVGEGEMETGDVTRRERDPFPPSSYEG